MECEMQVAPPPRPLAAHWSHRWLPRSHTGTQTHAAHVLGGSAFERRQTHKCNDDSPLPPQAWPSLLLMVFARDDMGERDHFVSYAVCPLPTTSGLHQVSARTWYPAEAKQTQGRNLFGGSGGCLPPSALLRARPGACC